MTGESLDSLGRARAALNTVVTSNGAQVLGDPAALGNALATPLYGYARERGLLVAAAEAGVAADLAQYVGQQHMAVDTAIALAAEALTQRRQVDLASSTWVATEYAMALGYQPQGGVPPTVSSSPQYQATQFAPAPFGSQTPQTPPASAQYGPPVGQGMPASYGPPSGQGAPGPFGAPPQGPPSPYQQPFPGQAGAPQPGAWPGAQQGAVPQGPMPPGAWPSMQPGALGGGPPRRSPKRGILIGVGGGVAAIAAIIVAVALSSSPSHSTPTANGGTEIPTSTQTVTVPPPGPVTSSAQPPPTKPSLAAGVSPVTKVLPADITDPTTQCVTEKLPFSAKGLVTSWKCDDPGLPGGQVFAVQTDGTADFQATWKSFNKWWGFNSGTASTVCPPSSSSSSAEGISGWHSNSYPHHDGQVVECETVGTGSGAQKSYATAYPTQDAFIIAQAPHSWTYSQLQKWWENN